MTPLHGSAKPFHYFWVRLALWKIMKWTTFGNFTLPIFHPISPSTASPPFPKALLQLSVRTPCSLLFSSYQNPSLGKNLISVIYTLRWNSFYLTVERKIVLILKSFEHLGAIGGGRQRSLSGIPEILPGRSAPSKAPRSASEDPADPGRCSCHLPSHTLRGILRSTRDFIVTTNYREAVQKEYISLIWQAWQCVSRIRGLPCKPETVWLEAKIWSALHTTPLITHAK